MRYLSSASNPLAHYWEEDLSGIWGIWLRLRGTAVRTAERFFGEIILANLYLARTIVADNQVTTAVLTKIAAISASVNIGAAAKRTIDIIGASIGLILSLPFWLFVPILIKLNSKGPILYRQERVGLNRRRRNRRLISLDDREGRSVCERRRNIAFGKPFMIVKFRTMYIDAERVSGPIWATRNDPRITAVGRFLRKTRIDEIPQLFNVLKGDMSLVGPRPERPHFVKKLDGIIKDYRGRFDVRPGITGLAQVEHKYDECLEDVSGKIKFDLKYIRNRGLVQDVRIMLKTMIVILTARGM